MTRQHCGTTGHLENCQVGVFLAYASPKGHTLLDRELYVPMRWIKDRKRCQEAGIPDTVRFQTKCEQARQMIERLWQAKVPFAWVVADTVYGGNEDLRTWLEAALPHKNLSFSASSISFPPILPLSLLQGRIFVHQPWSRRGTWPT